MSKPFLKDPLFWQRLAWGVLVALLAALGTLIFVVLMNLGLGLVWDWLDKSEVEAFSGTWQIVAIMTAAGLIVGLIHHFTKAEEVNVFQAVQKGHLDPKPVPASLLVSLVSLIGGFSVGPEVPSGMLAGGLGTWLSERRKMSDELRETNVLSGVVSAYGGLFTSPFAFVLMRLELAHMQTPAYFGIIAIAAVAATLGFAFFYALAGEQYADLLRLLDLPSFTLELWHLVIALVFSVVGAALALVYGLTMGTVKRLVAPLENQPILRCTLAGLLLGLLGMALPLTLFLGSEGLEIVTDNGAEMGVALVIVLVFAKILATAGAISTGFIGGPIFPLFFVGGTAGTAINLIFPDIPLALAVGCTMAALTAAALPAPFMITIVVLLVVGIPATEAIPIILAALVAHAITFGLGILPRPPAAKKLSAEAAKTADPGAAATAGGGAQMENES
jgi:H+/Cl- antiporter ClcA